MKILKNWASLQAIAGITIIAGTLTTSFSVTPAFAQRACQCTDYVANRFGLSGYPNAGDWNDGYLQRNGFVSVQPQPGAIAVMERSFPGSDPTYGHVGVVESISNGKVSLRGANQYVGSSLINEAGCSNVRITSFGANVNGSPISFWMRNKSNTTTPPNTSNIIVVNFSAIAAPEGVNIRSAPSLNASIVGRGAPNQRLNFDAWTYGDTVLDRWINTPDARWYRIAGTNNWVASAVVNGNAPGSRPMR